MILVCPEQGAPFNYRFQMFFFSRFRVLHVVEQLAGKFTAATAILKVFPVHGTVIQRTCFSGHHFLCPESRTLYVDASGTGGVKIFTLVAFQSAGR